MSGAEVRPDNQSRRASVFQLRKVFRVDQKTQLAFTSILDSGHAEYFDGTVPAEVAVQSRRYVAQFHIKTLEVAKLCLAGGSNHFFVVSRCYWAPAD